MPFYEIEFPLNGLSTEDVEEALFEQCAASITFLDRGDEPVLEPLPGEVRLWSDTLVRALFDAGIEPALSLAGLAGRLGPQVTATARIRRVEDRVWERVWLDDWRPMRFGSHLWICPTDAPPPADAGAVIVRLDPGLAFGTGTHPTTALCLETLEGLPLRGRTVLDYGCGSGILAIAALKLGAAGALAVDLDPQALLATRANALQNGVSDSLRTQDANAAPAAADCVLANILAGTLIELAPRLTAACRPGADLVLSGVLSTQCDAVAAAYSPDFDIVRTMHRDDWCCLHARSRTGTRAAGA
jgi:ribosomal protein L11 methyltransferase